MTEATLSGIFVLAIAIGAIGAVLGVALFGVSVWAALLIYSLTGTAGMFFVAWRRFRCIERQETHIE